MKPGILEPGDSRYPAVLRERLGADAPASLSTLGNLALPKTALFCSSCSSSPPSPKPKLVPPPPISPDAATNSSPPSERRGGKFS